LRGQLLVIYSGFGEIVSFGICWNAGLLCRKFRLDIRFQTVSVSGLATSVCGSALEVVAPRLMLLTPVAASHASKSV
jgi:hypothetical protein